MPERAVQRAAFFFASLAFAGLALGERFAHGAPLWVMGIELAAAALLVVNASLFRKVSERSFQRLAAANAVLCSALLVLLAANDAGARSIYFGALIAVPPLFVVLAPGSIASSVFCSATGVLFGSALLLIDRAPLGRAVLWTALVLVSAALATVGAWLTRALQERERAALKAEAQANGQLEQQRRMATFGRLAAGVAHEVNNPLAFIRGNIGFLEEELRSLGAKGELHQVLAELTEGVDRIASLCSELRGFERDAPEVRPEPLAEIVAEAVREVRALKKDVEIECRLPEAPQLVAVERERFVESLVHLLRNSIDALRTAAAGPARIRIVATQQDSRVQLQIEDDGPGIPSELHERIFEPFATHRRGQGGLGLALAREHLLRMNGGLEFSTAPEGGSCFTVRVPIARPG